MVRCRSLYICFIGAVFLLSLYNFVVLIILSDSVTLDEGEGKINESSETKADDNELPEFEENIEIEIQGQNNHVFQKNYDENTLEELEVLQETLPEPKIFWPSDVELSLTKSEGLNSCDNFRHKTNHIKIVKIEAGTWNTCGRPHNAFAELEDGTQLCIRYRHPHDFLVAGEALSYCMAVTLGLQSVPCVLLQTVSHIKKWHTNLQTKLGWDADNTTVALIQWVPLKHRLRISNILLNQLLQGGEPTFLTDITSFPKEDLKLLAQWSDLIVFDYLTGQYDRVASLQDEAEKQNATSLLQGVVRNLAVDSDNFMWFFDNEGGLLDGYITLYQETPTRNDLRFQKFHEDLLQTLCVFRRSTVSALNHLYQNVNPLETFLADCFLMEPLLTTLHIESNERFKYLKENFHQRLTSLIGHFKYCADRTNPS